MNRFARFFICRDFISIENFCERSPFFQISPPQHPKYQLISLGHPSLKVPVIHLPNWESNATSTVRENKPCSLVVLEAVSYCVQVSMAKALRSAQGQSSYYTLHGCLFPKAIVIKTPTVK